MKGLGLKNGIKILSDKDYYHSRLERLFFCEVGGMIGALNKGSKLNRHLNKPITRDRSLAILRESRDLINTYEPDLQLLNIGVSGVRTGNSTGLIIYTEYKIKKTDVVIKDEFIKIKEA